MQDALIAVHFAAYCPATRGHRAREWVALLFRVSLGRVGKLRLLDNDSDELWDGESTIADLQHQLLGRGTRPRSTDI